MPYARNDELPPSIRGHLPPKAGEAQVPQGRRRMDSDLRRRLASDAPATRLIGAARLGLVSPVSNASDNSEVKR